MLSELVLMPTRNTGGNMLDKDGVEILDEVVLYQSSTGTFRRVRRWLRGWHKDKGQLCWGWTGQETVQECDVIKAMDTFEVE